MGTSMLQFVDGKVIEDWANADLLGLLQQVGVLPETGQSKVIS